MDNRESIDRSSEELSTLVPASNGPSHGEDGLRSSMEGPPQPLPKAMAAKPSPLVDSVMQSDVGFLQFPVNHFYC